MKTCKFAAALSFVCSCFAPLGVHADEAISALPTVTKAFDIFEKYPARVSVGTVVAFKKKNNREASRIVDGGVQARVFALNTVDVVPQSVQTKDDCELFVSTVFQLTKSGADQIVLDKVGEAWLNPSSGGLHVNDGRYFIVFEKTGPAKARFRLRSSDKEDYFASGFLLTISKDGGNLKTVTDEYAKRQGTLDVIRLEIDNPAQRVPCYKYAKYSAGLEPDASIEHTLALCKPDYRAEDQSNS